MNVLGDERLGDECRTILCSMICNVSAFYFLPSTGCNVSGCCVLPSTACNVMYHSAISNIIFTFHPDCATGQPSCKHISPSEETFQQFAVSTSGLLPSTLPARQPGDNHDEGENYKMVFLSKIKMIQEVLNRC